MAFPVIQASNVSKTNGASSHTASLPASIVAGEFLVLFFTCDSSSTITTPSGWTSVKDYSNGSRRLAMFTKTATGSEGATVAVTTSGTTDSVHASYRVSTNNYTVTVSTGANGSPSDNSPDPDTLTNGSSGQYLWFAVCGAGANVTAYPTNYNTNTRTETQDAFSLGVGTRSTETDVQNPSAFTTSGNTAWVAFTASLAPQTPYIGSFPILAMASTILSIGISYGATATTALLTMASQIFTPTTKTTNKTNWQNETKPTTSWNNEQL